MKGELKELENAMLRMRKAWEDAQEWIRLATIAAEDAEGARVVETVRVMDGEPGAVWTSVEDAMPTERHAVLVQVSAHEGVAVSLCVGYWKQQSVGVLWVTPGVERRGRDVTHWLACLPSPLNAPGWPGTVAGGSMPSASPVPPASEPAPRETPRCACRHEPNHTGPLAEAHGCPCGPSCPCIADETPAAPTCTVVAGCDKLATAKGGRACVDHSGMAPAAPTGTARDPVHLLIVSRCEIACGADRSAAKPVDASSNPTEVTCPACRGRIAAPPPPPAETSCDQCSTRHALYGPCPPPPAEHGGGEALPTGCVDMAQAVRSLRLCARAAGNHGLEGMARALRDVRDFLCRSPAPAVPANGAEDPLSPSGAMAMFRWAAGYLRHTAKMEAQAVDVYRALAVVERLAREVADLQFAVNQTARLREAAIVENDALRARAAELTAELAVASEARDLWMAQRQEKDRQIEAAELRLAELESRAEEARAIAENHAVPEGGESGQACADIAEMLRGPAIESVPTSASMTNDEWERAAVRSVAPAILPGKE